MLDIIIIGLVFLGIIEARFGELFDDVQIVKSCRSNRRLEFI